jgi:threonine synthase
MGLPMQKIIIATNENDILYGFWKTGAYEKEDNAHAGGVKQTLSPAMDILISSNFAPFVVHGVWRLRFRHGRWPGETRPREPEGQGMASGPQGERRLFGRTASSGSVRAEFSSERVTDAETLVTIRDVYRWTTMGQKPYVLDPHSAVSVTAALRCAEVAPGMHYMALLTAHPAKFSDAVEKALESEKAFRFEDILPEQFFGLDRLPRRLIRVKREGGLDGVRKIIIDEVDKELRGASK